MKLTPSMLRLYAVTDRSWSADEADFWRRVSEAMEGGAQVVQLREKHLSHEAMLRAAERFVALCRKCGAVSIINDDVEAAVASGADGVHVGAEDLPVRSVRERVGQGMIVGATAKTVAQAQAAEAAGADYLGVGAVFPSPTKQNAIRITAEELRTICASVSIPAVAIGGITRENLGGLRGCGMAGIAVVSAIFSAEDIQAAARELRAAAADLLR